MSEDTYIFPNTYSGRGATAAGAPIPLAPPQVLGNNLDVDSSAWEFLSGTGCQLATGVRVKNHGSTACMIQIAQTAAQCPTQGFHLEEGEEVFLEVGELRHVFVKGVGDNATLTFIAS